MLFKNEKVIISSNNDSLALTNLRVKYDERSGAKSKTTSITLDSVSSCGLTTQSQPLLMVVSVILLIGGAFAVFGKSDMGIGMIVLGIVFAAIYVTTKSAVITIRSNGGESITVPAKGMDHESVLKFVDAVTNEKLRFIGKISE